MLKETVSENESEFVWYSIYIRRTRKIAKWVLIKRTEISSMRPGAKFLPAHPDARMREIEDMNLNRKIMD
jgi:hypothetical protein